MRLLLFYEVHSPTWHASCICEITSSMSLLCFVRDCEDKVIKTNRRLKDEAKYEGTENKLGLGCIGYCVDTQ